VSQATAVCLRIKPRPNDRNVLTQRIATLLGAMMLRTFGHPVAMCCDLLGVVGSNLKMVKISMQYLWMLHDVVVVWPGPCNNAAPGHAH